MGSSSNPQHLLKASLAADVVLALAVLNILLLACPLFLVKWFSWVFLLLGIIVVDAVSLLLVRLVALRVRVEDLLDDLVR